MMISLRLIHILSGVFWAGAVFFSAAFLVPAIVASGPAGGQVMRQLIIVRRLPVVAGIASLLTILSGAAMYWRNSSLSGGVWAASTQGMTYGIGAVTALLTAGVAATIVGPTGNKLTKLGAELAAAGGPPTADQMRTLGALQNRMLFGTRIGAALIGATVITMAVARYL
jgi:uncharacterized membrane protein